MAVLILPRESGLDQAAFGSIATGLTYPITSPSTLIRGQRRWAFRLSGNRYN
jgi:hypothetical protein